MRRNKVTQLFIRFIVVRISGLSFLIFCMAVCYLISMILGDLSFFWQIFWSLAGRSLSLLFCKIGFSGGLAFAIGLAVKAILTADWALSMLPSGSSTEPHAPSCEPSGLQQTANDLIQENLQIRKTESGEGQDENELRKAVEQGNDANNVADLFNTIQELKTEKEFPNKECPLTNCALNQVKDFQSHVQDGRGGGKPNDCSNREEGKTHE